MVKKDNIDAHDHTLTGGLRPEGKPGSSDRTLTGGIIPDSPPTQDTLTGHPGIKSTSDTDIREWNIGDIIDDKYRIVEKLGQGGMGLVVKIHHLEWNMDMALKWKTILLFLQMLYLVDHSNRILLWFEDQK